MKSALTWAENTQVAERREEEPYLLSTSYRQGATLEDSHAHYTPQGCQLSHRHPTSVASLEFKRRLVPLQNQRSSLEKVSPPREFCLQGGSPKYCAVTLDFTAVYLGKSSTINGGEEDDKTRLKQSYKT